MEPLVRPVTLFTQAGCEESTRARACLISSEVPFVERNVTPDPETAHALLATGLFATPLVVAGDQAILVTRPRALAQRLGFVCRCSDAGE